MLIVLAWLGSLAGCRDDYPPNVKSLEDIQKAKADATSIDARELPDADVPALGRFRQMTRLDFYAGYGVGDAAITDEGLRRLAALPLPKLTALSLGRCSHITDNGLAHVASIGTLKDLMLPGCPKITDDGLKYLVDAKELTFLDLRGCPGITDRGLEILAQKKDWDTILLSGCVHVSDQAVKKLEAKLPQAKIGNDDKLWPEIR
jgi:hypothetical protein